MHSHAVMHRHAMSGINIRIKHLQSLSKSSYNSYYILDIFTSFLYPVEQDWIVNLVSGSKNCGENRIQRKI